MKTEFGRIRSWQGIQYLLISLQFTIQDVAPILYLWVVQYFIVTALKDAVSDA